MTISGTGLPISTMPTGLPSSHVELSVPVAAGAPEAPKAPPGVRLFTEKPSSPDARPAGETTTPTSPGPGTAADLGKPPSAEAAPGDGQVPPPAEPPGATPAEQDPMAIAEAAREKALARARAGAARKRQEAEQTRQLELARQERLQAEQRARQAEFTAQDMLRIRQIAQTGTLQEKLAAAQALGISVQELGDAYVAQSTPEGKIQAELARVRAEQARDREALQNLQNSIAQQAQLAEMSSRQQKFVEEAHATKTVAGATEPVAIYPELVGIPKAFVLTLGQDLLARTEARHVREGLSPEAAKRLVSTITYPELLGFLNDETARHRKAGKSSTPATTTTQKSNLAPAGATGSASQPTPRTAVTNADKDEPLNPPKEWDSLSDAEQRKWLAKNLRGKLVRRSED